MTCKNIVPEMTYTVSSRTLNLTQQHQRSSYVLSNIWLQSLLELLLRLVGMMKRTMMMMMTTMVMMTSARRIVTLYVQMSTCKHQKYMTKYTDSISVHATVIISDRFIATNGSVFCCVQNFT